MRRDQEASVVRRDQEVSVVRRVLVAVSSPILRFVICSASTAVQYRTVVVSFPFLSFPSTPYLSLPSLSFLGVKGQTEIIVSEWIDELGGRGSSFVWLDRMSA